MPFTFSHPAAVIPLLKINQKYISKTGLLIGSLSPDFEYFIRMKVKSHYGHTYLGILYFDLPLAIFVGIVFHYLIKSSMILNSPLYVKRRMWFLLETKFSFDLKNRYKILVTSIVIGAFTHVVWDDFTHSKAFFVDLIPFLRVKLFGLQCYRWLQHLSSVAGIIFCFTYFHKTEKIKSPTIESSSYSSSYWMALFLIFMVVMVIWYLAQDPYWYIGDIVAAAITAAFISFSAVGGLFQWGTTNKLKT